MADSKPAMDEIEQFHGVPHYFYLEDHPSTELAAIELTGETVRSFLNNVVTSNVEALNPGECQKTIMHTTSGDIEGVLTCVTPYRYNLTVPSDKLGLAGSGSPVFQPVSSTMTKI